MSGFHAMIKEQRDALRSYVGSRGDGAVPTPSVVRAFVGDGPQPQVVSEILRNDYTAFSYAAISYAMLVELAFRLYDPDLRALAPKHLNGYAEAAQTINQLIISHGRRRARRRGAGVSMRLSDVQHGRLRLCLVG